MKESHKIKNQVFISYAHNDILIVESICKGLINNNIETWWDKASRTAKDLENELMNEIEISRFFLFFLSNNSLKKVEHKNVGYVCHELKVAINAALKRKDSNYELLICHLDKSKIRDLNFSIENHFNIEDGIEDCIDKISTYVKKRIATPTIENKFADAHDLLQAATLAHLSGDNNLSLTTIEQVLSNNPKNIEAWNLKGVILNDLERPREAIECFELALEDAPEFYGAINNMGVSFIHLKDFERAIDLFDQSLAQIDTAHDSWVNKCYALVGAGKELEAISEIERGLCRVPDDIGRSRLWNAKGIALLSLADDISLDSAEDAFNKAIKLDSDFSAAIKNLENVNLIMMQRYQDFINNLY